MNRLGLIDLVTKNSSDANFRHKQNAKKAVDVVIDSIRAEPMKDLNMGLQHGIELEGVGRCLVIKLKPCIVGQI